MNLMTLFPVLLAAQKLPIQALMAIAALGGSAIIFLSYSNWRRAVKAAFIILLLEGAIRKWLFNSGQELVYFLKDAVLLGAYIRFYLAPDPELRAWRIRAPGGVIALLAVVVALAGMNPNIGSIVLAAYGVKIYLFYIPLAFMMPYLFRSEKEMLKQLCWYAVMAAPICVLGIVQSKVSGESALSVYAEGAGGVTMGDAAGTVRVTGTFSYITGHTTFIIFFTTLHLALLMSNIKKFYWWLLLLDLPLLVGNGFMGGSRASLFAVAFVVVGFILAGVFTRITLNKSVILIMGVGSLVAVFAASIIFASSMQAWVSRATNSDTLQQRVVDHPFGTLDTAIKENGLVGYGIGMTHPAVDRLRNVLEIPRPAKVPPTYDSEMGQVVVEVGFLGFFAWYALRFMVLYQSFDSFKNCRPGSLRTLLLAAFLLQIPYLMFSVVLNHFANFMVWACYGLTLIPRLESTVRRRAPIKVETPLLAERGQRI